MDKKTVEMVARLARINLTEKEKEKFIKELKSVLEAFQCLEEVDTKDIEPSFQPVEIKNAVREDRIENGITQAQALSNTQNKESGYFKGPKIK